VTKNRSDETTAQRRCLFGWAFLNVNNCSGLVDGASKYHLIDYARRYSFFFYQVLYFHVHQLKTDLMLTNGMEIIFDEKKVNMLAMKTSFVFTINFLYNKNLISTNTHHMIINKQNFLSSE
jgi:hypothetical protein